MKGKVVGTSSFIITNDHLLSEAGYGMCRMSSLYFTCHAQTSDHGKR